MVTRDKGEIGSVLDTSSHGSLDLEGTDMCELLILKVSKTLFEVMSV